MPIRTGSPGGSDPACCRDIAAGEEFLHEEADSEICQLTQLRCAHITAFRPECEIGPGDVEENATADSVAKPLFHAERMK